MGNNQRITPGDSHETLTPKYVSPLLQLLQGDEAISNANATDVVGVYRAVLQEFDAHSPAERSELLRIKQIVQGTSVNLYEEQEELQDAELLQIISKKFEEEIPTDVQNICSSLQLDTEKISLITEQMRIRVHEALGETSAQIAEQEIRRELQHYRGMIGAVFTDPLLSIPGNQFRQGHTVHTKGLALHKLEEWMLLKIVTDSSQPNTQTTVHNQETLNSFIQKIHGQGIVFFDVNAMKSLIDCTSHTNGSKFLQELALSIERAGELMRSTGMAGSTAVPGFRWKMYSSGGDEFVCTVRLEETLCTDQLEAIVAATQQYVEHDPALQRFVPLESPDFLLKYAGMTAKERERFLQKERKERQQFLRDVRAQLPQELRMTISGGALTMAESMRQALLQPKAIECSTFYEFVELLWESGLESASDACKERKITRMVELESQDPLLYRFYMRNTENRKLTEKIQNLKNRVAELTTEVERLR